MSHNHYLALIALRGVCQLYRDVHPIEQQQICGAFMDIENQLRPPILQYLYNQSQIASQLVQASEINNRQLMQHFEDALLNVRLEAVIDGSHHQRSALVGEIEVELVTPLTATCGHTVPTAVLQRLQNIKVILAGWSPNAEFASWLLEQIECPKARQMLA